MKIANKLTESMMTALEETKVKNVLNQEQGLTFMYALMKGRNYTKLHEDSSYINGNENHSH